MIKMITLQPSNFNVNKYNQLCVRSQNSQSDFIVIFYKSSNCILCYNLSPGFFQVTNIIQGCTFATIDLTDPYKTEIRKLALKSTTPLNHVPKFILYFKDIPISEYQINNRIHNLHNVNSFIKDFKNWIITVASEVQTKIINNEFILSEANNSTCIGDRCELSIPISKPTKKLYKKLE